MQLGNNNVSERWPSKRCPWKQLGWKMLGRKLARQLRYDSEIKYGMGFAHGIGHFPIPAVIPLAGVELQGVARASSDLQALSWGEWR